MPRGNRTGPMGSGPMTGRRMGSCSGSTGPGFKSSGPGYGFGREGGFGRGLSRGFGLGRGSGWRHPGFGSAWGHPYFQEASPSNFIPLTEEQEMDVLEEQAKILEVELKQLKKRQAELKKRNQESK